MHPVQQVVYAALIRKDKENEEERWRDRLEYLARFWNSEAVDKVQDARNRAKATPDDKFSAMLESTFGRGLGSSVRRPSTVQELGEQIKQAGS